MHHGPARLLRQVSYAFSNRNNNQNTCQPGLGACGASYACKCCMLWPDALLQLHVERWSAFLFGSLPSCALLLITTATCSVQLLQELCVVHYTTGVRMTSF